MPVCKCGAEISLDQIRCFSCGKRFALDPLVAGQFSNEPPVSKWQAASEAETRSFSDESMREVREEAKKREKAKKSNTSKKIGKGKVSKKSHSSNRSRSKYLSKFLTFATVFAVMAIGLIYFDRIPNNFADVKASIDSIADEGSQAIGSLFPEQEQEQENPRLFDYGNCFANLDTSTWSKEQPDNPSAYLLDVIEKSKIAAESNGYMEYRWLSGDPRGQFDLFNYTEVTVQPPAPAIGTTWQGFRRGIDGESGFTYPIYEGVFSPVNSELQLIYETPALISVKADGTFYSEVVDEDNSRIQVQIGVKDGLVAGMCGSYETLGDSPSFSQELIQTQYKVDELGNRIMNSNENVNVFAPKNEKLGESDIFDNDLMRMVGQTELNDVTDAWPIATDVGQVLDAGGCLVVVLNPGEDGSELVSSLKKYQDFASITGKGYLGITQSYQSDCSFLETNYGGVLETHKWEPVF
jgi:hypothetical protein